MTSDEIPITKEEVELINELVAHFDANRSLYKRFLEALHIHISESESLGALVHSVKRRLKGSDRLTDKLTRQLRRSKSKGDPFDITKDNLFFRINDLGAYRILHLHTRQMGAIHKALLELLDESQWAIFEEPKARIWDEETKGYFESIGIKTEYNPRMYSSVHYVVQPISKAKLTIEIQVRTLSEEVWGEVDHKINYPYPTKSLTCQEQIKVLARVASSCTRLVDSIFMSHADWQEFQKNGDGKAKAE